VSPTEHMQDSSQSVMKYKSELTTLVLLLLFQQLWDAQSHFRLFKVQANFEGIQDQSQDRDFKNDVVM